MARTKEDTYDSFIRGMTTSDLKRKRKSLASVVAQVVAIDNDLVAELKRRERSPERKRQAS